MRSAAVVAAGLCLLATPASGAAQPRLSTGARFTLASGFQYDLGAGSSALGPDGTVWLAQPVAAYGGFRIVARTTGGRALHPGVAAGSGGSAYSRPAIAAAAGAATFVWEAASDADGPSGVAAVKALRCTLSGCEPVQTLSSWRWTYENGTCESRTFQATRCPPSALSLG
jgi:hypothetical protein